MDTVVDLRQSQLGKAGVIHLEAARRLPDAGQHLVEADGLPRPVALNYVHLICHIIHRNRYTGLGRGCHLLPINYMINIYRFIY